MNLQLVLTFALAASPKTGADARALEKQAHALQEAGKYREAEAPLRQAAALWTRLHGQGDIEVLNDEMNLAVAMRRAGDAAQAAPMLEHVAEGLAKSADPDAPELHRKALNNLAQAYRSLGRLADARRTLESLLPQVPEAPPSEERARLLDNLSSTLLDGGDVQGASRYAERGLAVWRAIRPDDDVDVAISRASVGTLYMRQGRLAEAKPLIEASLAALEKKLGPDHPQLMNPLMLRAELAVREGDRASARQDLSRAIALGTRTLGADHPDVKAARAMLDNLDAR